MLPGHRIATNYCSKWETLNVQCIKNTIKDSLNSKHVVCISLACNNRIKTAAFYNYPTLYSTCSVFFQQKFCVMTSFVSIRKSLILSVVKCGTLCAKHSRDLQTELNGLCTQTRELALTVVFLPCNVLSVTLLLMFLSAYNKIFHL